MLCPISVPAGEATGLCTSCFYCLGHCLSTDPCAWSLTPASEAFLAVLSETTPTCTPTTHLVYTLLPRLHWAHTYLALRLLSHHGMLPWRKMCFYFQVCLQAPEGYKLQYRSPKNFRQTQQEQEEVCYATGLVTVLPRCKHLCHVQGSPALRTQPHSLWGLISVINYNVGPK